jgi:hypothetical protein
MAGKPSCIQRGYNQEQASRKRHRHAHRLPPPIAPPKSKLPEQWQKTGPAVQRVGACQQQPVNGIKIANTDTLVRTAPGTPMPAGMAAAQTMSAWNHHAASGNQQRHSLPEQRLLEKRDLPCQETRMYHQAKENAENIINNAPFVSHLSFMPTPSTQAYTLGRRRVMLRSGQHHQ